MAPHHRRLLLVRGSRDATRSSAMRALAQADPANVLWIGDDAPKIVVSCGLASLRSALGSTYSAAVLDLHDRLDVDAIAQAEGLVRGGGALVLRLPQAAGYEGDPRLAAWPHEPSEAGGRMAARIARVLGRLAEPVATVFPRPGPWQASGTREQADAVASLAEHLQSGAGAAAVLTADRGRGKSAALGLLLRSSGLHGLDVVLTGPDEGAVGQVTQFAPPGSFRFDTAMNIVASRQAPDLVLVDEAAQLPVPLLRALVERWPAARFVFATTTLGYEGTGRGFTLRFVDWLAERRPGLLRLTLREPIRWGANDPVEAAVRKALLLDAQLHPLPPASTTSRETHDEPTLIRLDRDRLAGDERMLRGLFGLLVQAHYRTTPADLHRLLDAPNLHVHAALLDESVVAATLVAVEGGLTPELAAALHAGTTTLRGHALPDALVGQLGLVEAGPLRMVRSVRIATHPEVRRAGLARRLVEHVHRSYDADLFGTLFGATTELVRFRRSVGYEVARLSPSRGARSGEPAVVFLRPASEAGARVLAAARAHLAVELPEQLALLHADGELLADPDLDAALLEGLGAIDPATADPTPRVHRYAHGPCTAESVAGSLRALALTSPRVATLAPADRTLLHARVVDRLPWPVAAHTAGYPTPRAAMRALRRIAAHLTA